MKAGEEHRRMEFLVVGGWTSMDGGDTEMGTQPHGVSLGNWLDYLIGLCPKEGKKGHVPSYEELWGVKDGRTVTQQ